MPFGRQQAWTAARITIKMENGLSAKQLMEKRLLRR